MVRIKQYKCPDNVISKLKISVNKIEVIRMKGINLIMQKYVWKVEYPSNYCHIHLNLMKKRTLKEIMDALFISSGLQKTCVEELSLMQNRSTKDFVLLERKRFCLIRIQSFPYEKWKERTSNLKYFKVWGYLVKVQDPIPNRMKIGPMTSHCKIRLE